MYLLIMVNALHTTSLYAVTGTTSLYADTGGCGRGLGGAEGLAGGADRCICFIDGAQTSISCADAEDLAGGADRCSCLLLLQRPGFKLKISKCIDKRRSNVERLQCSLWLRTL